MKHTHIWETPLGLGEQERVAAKGICYILMEDMFCSYVASKL